MTNEQEALVEQLRNVEAMALGLHIAAADRGVQRPLTLTELGEVVVACGTAAVALASAPSAPIFGERHDTFWVLEKPGSDGPVYWDGGHAESSTRKIDDAIQWCRKLDTYPQYRHLAQWGWKVTEHAYMASVPSAPQPTTDAEHEFGSGWLSAFDYAGLPYPPGEALKSAYAAYVHAFKPASQEEPTPPMGEPIGRLVYEDGSPLSKPEASSEWEDSTQTYPQRFSVGERLERARKRLAEATDEDAE